MQQWPARVLVGADGSRLSVRHAPSRRNRPTVVHVHGLGGASTNFARLMTELAGDLDQVAVDLPGFGQSPPAPGGTHTIERLVEALVGYLVAHQSEPVHLVGNSMGGLVGVHVAARRPDLLRSLALVSPALPSWRVAPAGRLLLVLALPRVGERLLQRGRQIPIEAQVRQMLRDLFGDPERLSEEFVREAAEERRARMAAPHAGPVFLQSLRSIIREFTPPQRLWREVRTLTVPTLVVHGGRDRLVHSTLARWAAAQPRGSIVAMPTMGHMAQMERPDLVAGVLRPFWERVERVGPDLHIAADEDAAAASDQLRGSRRAGRAANVAAWPVAASSDASSVDSVQAARRRADAGRRDLAG